MKASPTLVLRTASVPAFLLASCEADQPPPAWQGQIKSTPAAALTWNLQSSEDGASLVLEDSGALPRVRLFCPAGKRELILNLPSFRPIGSEERLSFGGGGEVVALVADPSGDERRGGVTGGGPVPANLAQLLSGEVSASYGAQVSGPHPAPQRDLVSAFTAACVGDQSAEVEEPATPVASPASGSACLMQDGKPIPANALRAVGTEPFWAARVEGRCVTYSHPDDQTGTRVWTKFSGTAVNGTWTGSLRGQPFVMVTRPQAGCSDGMSDKRYPIAVSLSVSGEQRSGCAEPG